MKSVPEALILEIVKQTASASGVGEASVYQINREKKSAEGFYSTSPEKPYNCYTTNCTYIHFFSKRGTKYRQSSCTC